MDLIAIIAALLLNASTSCDAMKNSFQYQAPIQALWVTHPDYGITASWPVYLQSKGERYR